MLSDSLRIGCVKYLNARPLIYGWPGELQFDHPAALCERLAAGALDVALVSSFEFLRHPIYSIVDGVSIASDGPVATVFVAHVGDWSGIEEIELDPASLTSVNLLRCLLAESQSAPRLVVKDSLGSAPNAFGAVAGSLPAISGDIPRADEFLTASRQAAESPSRTGPNRLAACAPQMSPLAAGRARLLIGDQAIRFREKYGEQYRYWDLGGEWQRTVGLPFVYALWLIRPGVDDAPQIAGRLHQLRDKNLAQIDSVIAAQSEFDPEFCEFYYRRCLKFDFAAREKEGLRAFEALCEKHKILPHDNRQLRLV